MTWRRGSPLDPCLFSSQQRLVHNDIVLGGFTIAKTITVAVTCLGHGRQHQEDRLFLLDEVRPGGKSTDDEQTAASDERLQFYAVADGLGGAGVGDRAAQLALDQLNRQCHQLHPDQTFDFPSFGQAFVEQTNVLIRDALAGWSGMPCGTTLAVVAIDHSAAHLLSLGNSRVYLFRSGQLSCLTQDHVELVADRRQLNRYLGYLPQPPAGPLLDSVGYLDLLRGDVLLLATDGLTDCLSDAEISATLQTPAAFIQQIHQLRNQALRQGGQDNLAVIGIKIQQLAPEHPERPRNLSQLKRMRHIQPYTHIYTQQATRPTGRLQQLANLARGWHPFLIYLFFVLLGLILGLLAFGLPF